MAVLWQGPHGSVVPGTDIPRQMYTLVQKLFEFTYVYLKLEYKKGDSRGMKMSR
jgi:hypothetical protein